MQRKDCLRATDHAPTGSVTQRTNIERLFNIGVASPVSCTQWTGVAVQSREISPDQHNQHAQKPLGMVTNSARAQASNHRESQFAIEIRPLAVVITFEGEAHYTALYENDMIYNTAAQQKAHIHFLFHQEPSLVRH